MARRSFVDEVFTDTFPVFESDGYTKKTGETVFTTTIRKDGVVQAAYSSAIAEIGSTGEYKFTTTPDSIGFWQAEVLVDYNNDIFTSGIEVEQKPVEFGMTAVDDDSTISFAVWIERNGERLTDFDSVAAVVRSSDGTEIVDLGTDSADTSDGIFEFSTASANVPAGVEYYLDVTATSGSLTWQNNLGFAKVS